MKNYLKVHYILFFTFSVFMISCTSSDSDNTSKKLYNGSDINLAAKGELLDCLEGQTKILRRDFETRKLHRASTGCTSRFSICTVYKWVEDCVEDEIIPLLREEYYLAQRTATVSVIKLPGKKLLFKFPIGMMADSEFVSSDFSTFGFDSDYDVNGMMVIAADYTPVFTADEIQITVNIR